MPGPISCLCCWNLADRDRKPAATISGGAGISGKKKGLENIQALVIGGGVEPRTKRLLKVRNRSAAGCC